MAIQNIWAYASHGGGGGSTSTVPATAFVGLAPLLMDGSAGDTATGYSSASPAVDTTRLNVLLDLGSAPVIADHFTYAGQMTPAPAGGLSWAGSNDGVTWTTLNSQSFTNGTATTVPNGVPTGSRVAYRYYQMSFSGSYSSPITINITDIRLYDGSGTVIPFAAAAPLSPAYYYDLVSGAAPAGGSARPVSQFTNAPDITDYLSDANTATGYSIAATGNPVGHAAALIDLGLSPPPVTGFSLTFAAPTGSTVGLVLYSDDGTTWTQAGTNITTTGGLQTSSQTFAAQTHRYWSAYSVGNASGTYAVDEFSLVASAVSSAPRNLTVMVVY